MSLPVAISKLCNFLYKSVKFGLAKIGPELDLLIEEFYWLLGFIFIDNRVFSETNYENNFFTFFRNFLIIKDLGEFDQI